MSHLLKLEADVEIKASPEKFYHMWWRRPYDISNASPGYIQGCKLLEGEWGTVGAVVYWNYFHEGKNKVAEEIVEAVDPEKNLIIYKVIEGDLMKYYKSYSVTIQASHNGKSGVVHWTLDYEKLHEGIDDPKPMLDLCVQLAKDIDVHLTFQA